MRTIGTGPIRGRTSSAVRPVFEEFKPVSEWQQDDESHTLIIQLPSFFKEQIRVSTESQNTIRVRGERLVGGNKLSWFLENYQVPENCEMNSVRAKFQGGILNIAVPKKILENKPQFQEVLIPPKTLSPTTSTANTQKQLTPQKGQEEILPPVVGTSKSIDDKILEPRKAPTDPSTKHAHQDVARQVAERNKKSDELNEKHISSERTHDVMKNMVKNEVNDPEMGNNKELEKTKLDKAMESHELKNISEEKKMDHHKEPKGKYISEPSKGADYGSASPLTMGKKYVKGISELNEQRQLLVNMGVGILVIIALSAYVIYSFTSGKN